MKKRTLSTIIVLTLFSILMVSVFLGTFEMANAGVQSSDSNGDPNTWSMFHNNLSHTGNSTSTAPTTNTLLWSYTTGDAVSSSSAVVGGVVYVGSLDGKVYALSAVTGALIWSYATSNWVESSPAVAAGVVYIGSDNGKVYAFGSSSTPTATPTPIPQVSLTMGTVGQGTVNPSVGTHWYNVGTQIVISVTADDGYQFSYWQFFGGSTSQVQTQTLTLTDSTIAQAVFTQSVTPTPTPASSPRTTSTPVPTAKPTPIPIPSLTPSPSNSPTGTSTLTPSPSPTPTIPEFPSIIIGAILLIVLAATMLFFKRINLRNDSTRLLMSEKRD
jgi:PQQ-like domain/Divergent InlB B-repeat domain